MLMKKIKVESLKELSNLKEKDFIVNLKNLDNSRKKAAIYYLAGMVALSGNLKKINADEFMISSN